jgi:hypothetical protein
VYTEDLRNNESVYYLFADNDARTGHHSFRSYPNFVGIRIKKDDFTEDDSFWSDTTYEDNVSKIKADVKKIQNNVLKLGHTLVYTDQLFVSDIGEYRQRSPKTAAYIQLSISSLLNTRSAVPWV